MEKKTTKVCVMWTRVSTKRQEEHGGSLKDQQSKCERFAKEHGYKIVGQYGGTHESAKTPGALLRTMYNAIAKDKNISYILVSQIDRFSRNVAQASDIIDKLHSKGVTIVEADSGMDTSTREGMFMIKMKLNMAEWDNGNRTDKFTSGRKHCLECGVYAEGPKPLGYDKHGKSMNTTFTINATGELIRKAFHWKLGGMANCDIIERLKGYGLELSKQKIHSILTNPFYAGKLKHKMLGKEIKDGNQPKLISYEDFLRVQEILGKRTGKYKHRKETPRFPLKRHVRCSKDKTLLTAYTVKKKGIDYYKCNHEGCRTNVSAKKLHCKYEELLRTYNIPSELKALLKDIICRVMTSTSEEERKTAILLKKQHTELQEKIKKCKVRFGMDEIEEDVYLATMEALQEKLAQTELELAKTEQNLSNQDADIDTVLSMCCKLDTLWRGADPDICQRLQNLLFPNGILWDKENDTYRTFEENEALAVIRKITESCRKKKEENPEEPSSLVSLCA